MSGHVVVIGGGIAGLAAAYALNQAASTGAVDGVTLVEASGRLGGKIITQRVGDFVIEGGPDSFLTVKPHAVDLARTVGLDEQLVETLSPRHVYVLHCGRLKPLPDGMATLIPQRLGPFLRSGLFSPLEKARFALEPFIAPNPNGTDESLGQFVHRRLGSAAVDRLAAPLLAGIHAGDVDAISLRATFPQLAEAERRHGSLTAAVLAHRRSPRSSDGSQSMFMTLAGGLQELVDGVAGRLDRVAVRTGVSVEGIARHPRRGYAVRLGNGEILAAEAVVLALPSPAAAALLMEISPAAAAVAASVSYVSTAAIALGFRRADVGHLLAGHGYVVARGEGLAHTACTWVSSKWPHRAPTGHVLLRCYAGRSGEQNALALHDNALVERVVKELTPLLGISAPPVMARVFRWRDAMPQYTVGHVDRIAALEHALLETPGISVAGAGYRGVGIPDCIRQGFEAAQQAVAA